MRRRSLFLAPILLAACGPAAKPVVDDGRQAIASRTVLSDEVLWALGEDVQARVVGLSPMVDDPRYSSVVDVWPASVPRIGRNPEQLLAAEADLVIVAAFSDAEYRAAIADHTELLVLDDFSGFDAYLGNVDRIGQAVGAAPERIAEIRKRFVDRRAEIEARRAPESERPTVVGWDHGHVPGHHTSFHDSAITAGFRNLASEKGVAGHQRIDAEQLLEWDPDYIVVGCGEQRCEQAKTAFAEQPGFDGLRAVQADHVLAIEAPWLGSIGEGMLELSSRMQAAKDGL